MTNFFVMSDCGGGGHVAPGKELIVNVLSVLTGVNSNLSQISSFLPSADGRLESLPENIFSMVSVDIFCKTVSERFIFEIDCSIPFDGIDISDFSIAYYFYIDGVREKVRWYSSDSQWNFDVRKQCIQNAGFRVFFKDCFSNKSSKLYKVYPGDL